MEYAVVNKSKKKKKKDDKQEKVHTYISNWWVKYHYTHALIIFVVTIDNAYYYNASIHAYT